jgi:membrane protein implicated in regulation of membrane protease activity
MRPLELLTLSGIFAVFVGVVVLLSTREIVLALIFLGVAFVLSLVTLAMLALAVAPDLEERKDIDGQNQHH